MDIARALDFVGGHGHGVLITLQDDGRPHASNVAFIRNGDALQVSITAGRVKTRNVKRDPRVLLHVTDSSFWKYVVFDGTASLGPVAQAVDDEAVESLIAYYRIAAGEHPDWDEYRSAMVADRRLLLTLIPVRAYGQLPG